jgi:hypothetical protein
MERPVQCWFCKEEMYYSGDPRHVPEVRIDIIEDSKNTGDYYYAHKKCYRKFFVKKRCLSFPREVKQPLWNGPKIPKPGDP